MERKLLSIKKNALVTVQIGHHFYLRLQELFLHYYNQMDPEKALTTIKRLEQDRDPQDALEEHLLTLMSLIYQIEAKAQESGQMEEFTVTVPEEPKS